jgi:hypothetical protein
MGNPQIKFRESRTAYGPSGAIRAATLYDFSVDEKNVTVEVPDLAMRTRGGQMEQEQIKAAAEAFIVLQAERHGWDELRDYLVLNEGGMDVVVSRLGWNPRFGERSETI